MQNGVETKTAIGCVAAVFGYLYGSFNELLVVLVLLMLSDYILGLIVGIMYDGFDYHKGISGAVKKFGYMVLVLLAFLVDYVMGFVGQGMKIDTRGLFGYGITCYLIGTEGLSNLKLLSRLGLPVPDFLRKAFEGIQSNAENTDVGLPKTSANPSMPPVIEPKRDGDGK